MSNCLSFLYNSMRCSPCRLAPVNEGGIAILRIFRWLWIFDFIVYAVKINDMNIELCIVHCALWKWNEDEQQWEWACERCFEFAIFSWQWINGVAHLKDTTALCVFFFFFFFSFNSEWEWSRMNGGIRLCTDQMIASVSHSTQSVDFTVYPFCV